jgi:hypothetical protein
MGDNVYDPSTTKPTPSAGGRFAAGEYAGSLVDTANPTAADTAITDRFGNFLAPPLWWTFLR